MGQGIMVWFIGPQIIGFIYFLVGLIQKRFPPKKINDMYGYRSASAQKSQEAWDEANRYSAIYMIKAGLFILVAGLLLTLLLQIVSPPVKIRSAITLLFVLASAMGGAVMMMVATEKHLDKTFDNK